MRLSDVLKKKDNLKIVSIPDIKINDHWSFEFGNYWDTLNNKATKDFYFGLKFNMKW